MTCELSAIEIHTHLLELQAERALASIAALAANSTYPAQVRDFRVPTANLEASTARARWARLEGESGSLSSPRPHAG
jgi:hypothetical protein